MTAKYSQCAGTLRYYPPGKSFEDRDEFDGVASVIWTDEESVFIFGAAGKNRREYHLESIQELSKLGAKHISCRRAKGHRMPKPWRMIAEGKLEDTWGVDL